MLEHVSFFALVDRRLLMLNRFAHKIPDRAKRPLYYQSRIQVTNVEIGARQKTMYPFPPDRTLNIREVIPSERVKPKCGQRRF